ncbi:MAG: nuclear transport factor 2 family protein [Thermodesulfobacteriota bacterium]
MKTIIISIMVCVFIVASGFQAFGEEWTAEQKEVWKAVETDGELFKKGDVEGIMSLRHNDVLIWWSGKKVPYDKELLRNGYQSFIDFDKPQKWEINPLAIKIIGNMAIVFYSYKYSGNILAEHSRTMETWIKQDNKWLKLGGMDASCKELPPCQ